jgi:putative DNA-binding protein
MPSLLETQNAFRASMVEGVDDAVAAFLFNDALAASQRLSVYRTTIAGSLANALRLSFPAVQRLVGEMFFEGAAQVFVHERPPLGACLDDYGADFPDFLERFEPATSVAYLADVARLEWAVTRALHAADVEALDPAKLAEMAPCDHDRVRFVPHPSLSLVRTRYPAHAIWRAVLAGDDAAMAAIDLASGPAWLLVERLAAGVEVTRIDEPTWRFTEALIAGHRLGVALGIATDIDAPTSLARHIAAGRFAAFTLADPPSSDGSRECPT